MFSKLRMVIVFSFLTNLNPVYASSEDKASKIDSGNQSSTSPVRTLTTPVLDLTGFSFTEVPIEADLRVGSDIRIRSRFEPIPRIEFTDEEAILCKAILFYIVCRECLFFQQLSRTFGSR